MTSRGRSSERPFFLSVAFNRPPTCAAARPVRRPCRWRCRASTGRAVNAGSSRPGKSFTVVRLVYSAFQQDECNEDEQTGHNRRDSANPWPAFWPIHACPAPCGDQLSFVFTGICIGTRQRKASARGIVFQRRCLERQDLGLRVYLRARPPHDRMIDTIG